MRFAQTRDPMSQSAPLGGFQLPPSAPWWCGPAGIALGFLLPMYCLLSFALEFHLPGLTARGMLFLTSNYLMLGAGLIFAMAFGGWLGMQLSSGSSRPAPTLAVDRAALMLGSIALGAYALWFREYLTHPALLWSILSGASSPARSDELVTGVTSLANGGPVFFSLYAWRLVMRKDRPLTTGLHAMCAALAVFTAFRVYAWSERLALIEAVLPLALMFAILAARSQRQAVRIVVRCGPFLALPLLMLYFGLAESVRSWASDTYNGKLGFWDFVIGRMVTYYYTALNNGAGFLATQDWPTFRFEYTFGMLHTAPLSVGHVFSALVGSKGSTLDAFLVRYADIEFNNPSGLFTVVYDVGVPLAIVYFTVIGFLAGLLFRRHAQGSLTGALFYPMFFISYLEVFRYPYLGSGRAFAWAVCALLVLVMVYPMRAGKKAAAARRAVSSALPPTTSYVRSTS